MAAASAVATDHTPPTAESDVAPQRGSARNAVSRRGRTTKDISRFTAITTARGRAAAVIDGDVSAGCERWISAGSKACAMVARSRISGSSAAASTGAGASSPKPSPASPCRRRGPRQPPQAEAQHDGGGDHAEAGCRERRRAEERHGNGVLDGGRAGQRRHGEGRGAERDRRRHQAARQAGRAEQRLAPSAPARRRPRTG